MKRIVLVGCGNIGSRHLQALVKLPFEAEIEIIEPNKNAQEQARLRLNEIKYKNSNFQLKWFTEIKDSSKSDLAILATTSVHRVELIEELLKKGNSRFIIEKMVCQSDSEYTSILKLVNSQNAKGWVNASRRYYDSYRNIESKMKRNRRINLTVNTGNIGLGSNAIHFVDLFLWFTKNKDFSLNGDYLDESILPNRRGSSFKEFTGTITGKTSDGSTLSINFFNFDKTVPVSVNIFGEHNFLTIDETNQIIYDLNNQTNNEFKIEYQSSLTTKMVMDVFKNDETLLPSLQDSQISHSELFKIFNLHIKRVTKENIEKCPIT